MRIKRRRYPVTGWQVVHWLTGGVIGRTLEYKLLMPLLIIGLNILAWGQ